MNKPWKPSAITAPRLKSELIPCSMPNLEFKAFISAETYLIHQSSQLDVNRYCGYPGFIIYFALFLL